MKKTGEWGEFYPAPISLFGYNKTTAQLYYPLSKEKAVLKGYTWDDYEPTKPQVSKTIEAKDLPDNIKDTPENILDAAISCEITGKLFKITPNELQFYHSQKIPLPRHHPNQRYLNRFNKRNPRKLFPRTCAKCQKNISTTYAPERPDTVYCEKCYLETVY